MEGNVSRCCTPSPCVSFSIFKRWPEKQSALNANSSVPSDCCQMFQNEAESVLQSLSASRCWLARFPSSSHKALIRHGAMILCWPRCSCYISYWIINVFISRSVASPPHPHPSFKIYWPASSQHDLAHFCVFAQAVEQMASFQKEVIPSKSYSNLIVRSNISKLTAHNIHLLF